MRTPAFVITVYCFDEVTKTTIYPVDKDLYIYLGKVSKMYLPSNINGRTSHK